MSVPPRPSSKPRPGRRTRPRRPRSRHTDRCGASRPGIRPSSACGDRRRRGAIAAVAEDPVPAADLFRLDALERDGESLAPRLALKVDAHVEGVDPADDDPEAVTALDHVRVDESTPSHLAAKRQGLLMGLPATEDGLEAADELGPPARLLNRIGANCRAREPQRRHRCGKPADQAGEHDETSDPHGAEVYQTPRPPVAVLTNPLDPTPLDPPPAWIETERSKVIMGGASAAGGEWRGPESNRRHHGFQPCALPTELPRPGGATV